MKWQDVTPLPPDSISGNNIGRCLAIYLNLVLQKESTPAKDVGNSVDKTTIQFNSQQCNEMVRRHPLSTWLSFLHRYWNMSRNKPEPHFDKRVNTHEGCWYHSGQDHDLSLRLRNLMKWQDVTPPSWFSFPHWYWKMHGNKPESCFVKRVNTHEGCWYHSGQDLDPRLMLSNHMKWWDFAPLLPPDSLSGNNIGRCMAINLNLVFLKESIPEKNVGTTVDKTMITV
jgi:hypothetical protein